MLNGAWYCLLKSLAHSIQYRLHNNHNDPGYDDIRLESMPHTGIPLSRELDRSSRAIWLKALAATWRKWVLELRVAMSEFV